MKKPIKSISRVNAWQGDGFPTGYRKRAMWEDLNELQRYIEQLEADNELLAARNEKLGENLERFAPGRSIVADIISEVA